MFALQLVALAVSLLGALILAGNLWTLVPAEAYPLPERPPSVSVLVPARDEERSIETCVRSLLAQDYPSPLEVIVLDDGSTDATRAIVDRLAAEDSRLRVLEGAPLPPGWLGKPWACRQLADAASGEMLLFTDADTVHGGHALAAGVANASAEDADMLAGVPHIETVTFAEELILPAVPWSTATIVPLPLAYRLRWPGLSTAIGQYMLFRRSAYDAIGGHAAVRGEVLEDVMLARLTKAAGYRWRMADLTDVVSTRMYRSLREIVRGLGRTLFGVFDYGLLRLLLIGALSAVAFLLPPAVTLAAVFGRPVPGASVPVAAVTWLVATAQVAAAYRRLDYPPALALLSPLTVALYVLIALWSVVDTLLPGRSWKGRPIGRARPRWL